MSYRYHFFARFEWRPDAPPEPAAWVRAVMDDEHAVRDFEVPEPAGDMAELAGWMLSQPGVTTVDDWGTTVSALVHDDDQVTMYGLVWMLAPFTVDGLVAVAWTDMAPDVDPTLFFVQDGVMWVGGPYRTPAPATTDPDADEPVWRLGTDPMSAVELERFGLSGATELAGRAGPDVARQLLARSIAFGLDELAGGDTDRRAAAEAGARLVLDLLDEGGDPRIDRDSPGWQLQEVDRHSRYGGGPVRLTGRAVARLGAALDEVGAPDLGQVQLRLVEGEVVEVIGTLALDAYGPLVPIDVGAGEAGSTTHRFLVDVPVGARLRLTKVYEKGHAECWPVDADPFAWPCRPHPHLPGLDPRPVGPPGAYRLYHLDPRDEDRLWRRAT